MVDLIAASAVPELDERGELPLSPRNRLLTQILTLLPAEQQRVSFVGHLGLNCAEKSWPVWLDKFPDDEEPIEFAQRAVASATSGSAVPGGRAKLGDLKTKLIDKLELGDRYFPAVYAGFACRMVVTDMIERRQDYVTSGECEEAIYIDNWDAAFLASIAAAGGAVWEGVGRDDVRRDFWLWYLHKAIPNAFARASAGNNQL